MSTETALAEAIGALSSELAFLRSVGLDVDASDDFEEFPPTNLVDLTDLAAPFELPDELLSMVGDIDELAALVAATQGQLSADASAVDGVVSDADGSFEAGTQLLELLAALTEAGNTSVSNLDQDRARMGDAIDGFAGAVDGEHGPAAEEALAGALHFVADGLSVQISGVIDELAADAFGRLDAFIEDSVRSTDGLGETWATVLGVASEVIREQLVSELKAGVAQALHEGAEALAREVVEAGLTMTIGSQVTTAMMPVLPALVLAKKAAQAINELKDLLPW